MSHVSRSWDGVCEVVIWMRGCETFREILCSYHVKVVGDGEYFGFLVKVVDWGSVCASSYCSEGEVLGYL